VTCTLTSWNHIMSNMQDQLLQLMQLIQYHHVSSFSTIITNHFIGEEFCIGQASINGYEAIGFDVTQLTQDEEQSLFTIKTDMPISMLVYVDSFQWAKYGHHILLPSLNLTRLNKASLHRTFWNSLIEFHRFRWKSIFHLESSYCFQAGSLFVKFTRGSVRNWKQRQNF
jgi:hypothetical protein